MSEITWKWFKHGWQFDIEAKGELPNVHEPRAKMTVFCETKDKQEARRIALAELTKYGYKNIEITKITPRF